jgi:hypothetical protein
MVLIWIHCAGHVAESTMVFLFFLLQSRCPTAAQSYIHELAKGLPAPRKQNSACDACRYVARSIHTIAGRLTHRRSRKVKCNREDGAEKVCILLESCESL